MPQHIIQHVNKFGVGGQTSQPELEITTNDEPEPGHPHNEYNIASPDGRVALTLFFQDGTVPTVGINGLTIEALLAICIHRLNGFQSGKFKCDENERAKFHLQEALKALHDRTRSRQERKVEGTMQP